jgi:hypothetical protein
MGDLEMNLLQGCTVLTALTSIDLENINATFDSDLAGPVV